MNNKNEKVFDLLEKTGLNWTVNKAPLITAEGLTTESFGMMRNDNGNWLGTVGNQYRAFQNHEMAELMIEACEGIGLDMSRGGILQDGRKVYLQIPLSDKLVGHDTIKRNLTCLNSHDGTTSIGFGSTNTVVVCQNTFHKTFNDSSMSKFRHSTNSKENVERAMRDMRRAMDLDDQLMEKFEVMASMPIKDEILARVMGKVFDINLDSNESLISTRKKNQARDIANVLGNELKSHGTTLWGLFNGVTYYTNHVLSKGEKDDYVMVGGGYQKNLKAFDEIMKWVEQNTEKPAESVLA